MVAPILSAISESEDLEQLLVKLDALELDGSGLTRRLAQAMFIARGLGDAGPE